MLIASTVMRYLSEAEGDLDHVLWDCRFASPFGVGFSGLFGLFWFAMEDVALRLRRCS